MQALPMVVRIRFGRGSRVSLPKRPSAPLARLAASFLTLIAICLSFMGFWRLFEDLDLAGEFIFPAGILSHWQVWLAVAAGTQYAAWRLKSIARAESPTEEEIEFDAADEAEAISSGSQAALRR